MDRETLDKHFREFESGLSQITSKKMGPADRLRGTVQWINEVLEKIRQIVLQEGFKEPADEIYFFKTVKPRIKACLIYEVEHYRLLVERPAGPWKMINNYYQKQLDRIQRIFREYEFQYHYFKSDSHELDYSFFVRGSDISQVLMYKITDPETDPKFSTCMDSLFARFIASERLLKFLVNELGHLQPSHDSPATVEEQGLIWTGEAINLVEMAYGIWLTGQINNGEVTITEIICWMERKFKLKIGRAYRRWTEISRRKLISPTNYLDQMKDSINKRIEDENDLKSNRRRSSRKNDKK